MFRLESSQLQLQSLTRQLRLQIHQYTLDLRTGHASGLTMRGTAALHAMGEILNMGVEKTEA